MAHCPCWRACTNQLLPVRGSLRIATLLRALHLYLSSTPCVKSRQDDEPCSARPACSAPSPEEGDTATAAALGRQPNIGSASPCPSHRHARRVSAEVSGPKKAAIERKTGPTASWRVMMMTAHSKMEIFPSGSHSLSPRTQYSDTLMQSASTGFEAHTTHTTHPRTSARIATHGAAAGYGTHTHTDCH